MTRSAGRARDIDFSLAYFVSPHKVLVRRDSGLTAVGAARRQKLALVKSASVDAELKAAVPTMEIVFVDDYQAAFDALRERRVEGFLADELLLLAFAQRSGAPQDYHAARRLRAAAHRRLRRQEERAAPDGGGERDAARPGGVGRGRRSSTLVRAAAAAVPIRADRTGDPHAADERRRRGREVSPRAWRVALYCLPGVQSDHLFNALFDAGDAIRSCIRATSRARPTWRSAPRSRPGGPPASSVVPGPGFLNSSAALATAYSTGAQVLALIGQIPSRSIGKGLGFLHEIPTRPPSCAR